MDILQQLKAEAEAEEVGVAIPIMQKNGEPYPGDPTMTVTGSDSEAVRAEEDRATQRSIQRGTKRIKTTAKHIADNRVRMAAAAVVEWTWTSEGQPFPCTPDNVRVMLASAPHILRQVEEGIAAHADFTTKPSTSL